jgi:autotransporter-associated beta strand protein/T5SS/PEP-CTERM-associated repeat protein
MRSYRWRSQATRAAAPAAPSAALRDGAIQIATRSTPAALSRAALLGSVWLGALAMLAPSPAHAVDGTWTGPGTQWTVGTNWSSTPPNTVPDDIATFTNSPGAPTSVTIASFASVNINTIQFTAAAPAYSFTINPFATFSINGAGISNSSAFAPTFTNDAGLMFFNSGTAANAAITNNGGISFLGSSSAGSSTIINNGSGSLISFSDTSTAGNATITTNGGAQTQFTSNSDGGNARFITNAGGTVDFSGSSGPLGDGNISAGSIEGAGTYQLGTNRLIVGSNNLSTTVSGSIQDSGNGSFTKTGTGTLTLTGTLNIGGDLSLCNCQTGGLIISGGSATVGSFVEVDGGTLTVTNGGTLQTIDILAAANIIVNGAGSTVTATGVTAVGFFAPGSITIANGAVFNSQGGAEIDTLVVELGTPSVLVTGPGSTWNVGGPALFVGGGSTTGPGMLTVANGGTVTSTAPVSIGDVTGASTLTVTGAGSVLNALNSLTIGDNSCGCNLVGTLTVADGGVVNSPGSTSIAAGSTLNIGMGGLAGAINTPAIANDGQIIANFTDALTLTAAISGAGSLSKAGAGTLILTGSSTYTGGTTITGGTLQLGDGGANGSIVGNVTNNGTFAINRSDTFTFGGVISGSGAFQQNGTGTTIFTAANTYTGGTIVNAGTLRLGPGGSLAPTGALTVNAGGTFDLNSFNQTVGSLAGAGNVTLGAGRLTTGSDNTGTTFSGAISGTGGLTKIGAGTLVLTGTNPNGGATAVNGGRLTVNGAIPNSTLTVDGGATLGGIGTIGNAIINNGTLSPGNSIGTITVNGSLVMSAAASYLVEISPTSADRTNVGGTATLAGSVQAVFAAGSYVTRAYTIVSAAGGRIGTFNALTTTNLPANFTASLSYTATDAILNLTAALGGLTALGVPNAPSGSGAFACAFSINQCNVAGAINAFFNNGGTLPPAFANLFGLTGVNLGNALTLLSGEAATGAQQAAFQLTNQFLGIMLDPFVDGRNSIAGAGGPALGFAPEREELPDDIALAYAKLLKAPPAPSLPSPASGGGLGWGQRWSVWGAGYGGGGNRTSGDPAVVGSHDLTARTAGGAAGLDYHLSRDSVVGVALAGGGTDWSLAQGLGGGKSDAFQAGLYGTTRWGPAYVAAALAFTNHWMSTDRFAFAGDHLSASFNAQSFGGRVEGGYRFATLYGGLTPYAAVQAQNFRTPAYSEADLTAGGFALGYNGRTATDTRSELGGRFDRLLLLNPEAALTLRARVAWAHDWVSDPTLAAVFQALPGASFLVNGATPAKNSALTSAGAELRLANGVSLLAKFDGEFASHSSTYAGTGTVRYAW